MNEGLDGGVLPSRVLDEQQRAVVGHPAGPLCLFGGPGTGKTMTLEERFLRLARSDGVTADRILFLVPNRIQKLAVKNRLTRRLLDGDDDFPGLEALIEVPVATWHGLAHHLVTRHYDGLAYPEPPVLLTSPEHWGDIREALEAEPEANWPHHRHLLRNRGFVDEVVDFCIRAEQRLLEPHELRRLVELRPGWADIVRFFSAHRERLRQRSRVDYPTLLTDAVELIANHDDVREALQQKFLHILVDDGQELPRVQQRLLRFLTGFVDSPRGHAGRSLVVAADPDSAIETFRGAEPGWLDGFADEFGPHERVILQTSYRLGDGVGERAVSFIARNGPSEHRPRSFAGATSFEARRFPTLAAEVEGVARSLRRIHLEQQIPYEEMAILLTSPRSMLPALERALGGVEVPFSIAAPDRPLEREPAVRAFCNLARFAYRNEVDPDELVELLRSPWVGLEDAEVRELERGARLAGVDLEHYLSALSDGTDEAIIRRVQDLLQWIELLRAKQTAPADEAFWVVWESAAFCRDLTARARSSLSDPANRDLDALVAFSRALGRFVERRRGNGTLVQYLDAIGRADFGSDPWLPPERRSGGVEVLSFHAAKGREWSIVAVCGCVEGAIPKGRRAQGLFDPFFDEDVGAVERTVRNEAEDRRVFYVATTRARRHCLVTTSPGPSRKGQPSRFVAEIAGELPAIERSEDAPPLTFAEAAALHRRAISDVTLPAAERLAALLAMRRIWELDPGCSAAHPDQWWWRWDWTEGALTLRDQRPHDEDDLPPDKLRTSYSRISEYDNCGLKYLYQVVLGLDPETSHNMAFGTWIHKIFEECDKRVLTNGRAVFARYEELFDESVFPNKPIARQFKHDGYVMLERFINLLKPGEALLAEREFKIDFDGHRITGRIDRVDRAGSGVLVSDYKTSRNPIYYSEAADSLQLAIYYLAARADPEIAQHGEPVGMRLVYPAHMTSGDVTVRAQKPEDAVKVLERLPRLFEGVLAEDFRPSPTADCMWCKFKPICPLWPEGKEIPA